MGLFGERIGEDHARQHSLGASSPRRGHGPFRREGDHPASARRPVSAWHRADLPDPHPYPALSVREAVRVALAADTGKRKEGGGTREDEEGPTEDLLTRTGLFNQRFVPCAQLSQGASAASSSRGRWRAGRLLILDEIFSSLSAADEGT